MYSFEDYKKELLQDPALKKEWDSLDTEFNAIRKTLDSQNVSKETLTPVLPVKQETSLNNMTLFG